MQLFNVPVHSLKEEGVRILARDVGIPVAPSVEGFINGRRFIKQKLLVKLDRPLRDTLTMDHPFLGEVTIHCYYEKVARICLFCGLMGHELASCSDHQRLSMLLQKPSQAGRFDVPRLLSPKLGTWVSNAGCIPLPETIPVSPGIKRSYRESDQGSQGDPESFFQGQMARELPHPVSNSLLISLNGENGGSVKRPRPAGQDSPASSI